MQIVQPPNIVYSSIKINNQNIALSSTTCKASFQAPYNQIQIVFKTTNYSLAKFKVAVTASNEEFGIDKGNQITLATNVAINTNTTVYLPINSTLFNKGDRQYRILLCAQSALDYSWDVTEVFMCLGGIEFIPASDSQPMEVKVVTD